MANKTVENGSNMKLYFVFQTKLGQCKLALLLFTEFVCFFLCFFLSSVTQHSMQQH